MIQRIQTLFISAAIVLAIFLFFTPLITINIDKEQMTFCAYGFYGKTLWFCTTFTVINTIIMLIQLVIFRNRKKQIFIGKLSIFMWMLWIILFSTFIYFNFLTYLDKSYKIHFAAVFPVLIMALILLANRNIKKDEELVRSIDRIR